MCNSFFTEILIVERTNDRKWKEKAIFKLLSLYNILIFLKNFNYICMYVQYTVFFLVTAISNLSSTVYLLKPLSWDNTRIRCTVMWEVNLCECVRVCGWAWSSSLGVCFSMMHSGCDTSVPVPFIASLTDIWPEL